MDETSIESQIREAIAQLPDAEEFTGEDIGRIILRVRRVHRDVEPLDPEDGYNYLIGEIASLLIENARLVRIIERRQRPSDSYDS